MISSTGWIADKLVSLLANVIDMSVEVGSLRPKDMISLFCAPFIKSVMVNFIKPVSPPFIGNEPSKESRAGFVSHVISDSDQVLLSTL